VKACCVQINFHKPCGYSPKTDGYELSFECPALLGKWLNSLNFCFANVGVFNMQFVPWQNVADWHCKGCGYCCKLYSVVLGFPEWVNITRTFGAQTTISGLDHFYIKRHSDGTCAFLCNKQNNYSCGLQAMKPEACKIWPFKVLAQPKYGEPNQAAYDYMGNRLYVYADTMCSGLRYGTPTWEFHNTTIKEFTELALGIRNIQYKTTRAADCPNQWGRQLFP
jgi:Fe-S-cluster containining protein